jgi:hypothetical protein
MAAKLELYFRSDAENQAASPLLPLRSGLEEFLSSPQVCESLNSFTRISTLLAQTCSIWGEHKKGKFTHVRYRFSLEKARRKLLPCVTDRVLNDMLCFRGELTLGVDKIPFLEFSP